MNTPSFSYYMHDGPTAFSIELAGSLAAEDAKKLEQEWLSASTVVGKKALVVDLSFVTEIDPVGRQLLLRWHRNGATIVANTPESRVLVKSIIGRALLQLARIAYTSVPYRSGSFFRYVLPIVGLLLLLIPPSAPAQALAIVQPATIVAPTTVPPTTVPPTTGLPTTVQPTAPPESIAFARYIAWLQARDPFTEAGPVALAIVASLPGLDKQGSLLAIREIGESERSQYGILQLQGDAVVFERAIAPFLMAQKQAEDLPLSSVIITPENYKFCYAGVVETADSAAYVFRITPRKNRAGLIRGELWIEPLTGAPVLVSGYLVNAASPSIRSIQVVHEIAILDGHPFARTTHMLIEARPVGRTELTIIELPLGLADPKTTPGLITE